MAQKCQQCQVSGTANAIRHKTCYTVCVMKRTVIHKYIVADPKIAGGKLTFSGTRVMVWQILEALAHGESIDDILEDWPSITKKHVHAALEFAARRTEGERVTSLVSTSHREILVR